jgi:hypothetical protein
VPFYTCGKIASQIAFYSQALVNHSPQIDNFLVCQRIGFLPRINRGFTKNFQSSSASDAINVGQTNFNAFIPRQFNTSDARHILFSYLLYDRGPEYFHPCRCL